MDHTILYNRIKGLHSSLELHKCTTFLSIIAECECGYYGVTCRGSCDDCAYGCDNLSGTCLSPDDEASCVHGEFTI